MNQTLSYVVNRLLEKSTWVSLGTLLTGLGVTISPDHWQMIMGIGMGIGGLLGTLLPAKVLEANVTPSTTPTPLSISTTEKNQ